MNTRYQYWLYCVRCSEAHWNTRPMTEVEARDLDGLRHLADSTRRCRCQTCHDEPSDEKFFMLTCRDPEGKLVTVDIGEFTETEIPSETIGSARDGFAEREMMRKH